MNKLLIACMVTLLAAGRLEAVDVDAEFITLTTVSTNAASSTNRVSVTNATIRGYIEEIRIAPATAGTTGQVTLVAVPPAAFPGMANVTIIAATNITNQVIRRPRYDATSAGLATALTDDPPWRYCLVGETLIFSVVNSSETNMAYDCFVKYEKR